MPIVGGTRRTRRGGRTRRITLLGTHTLGTSPGRGTATQAGARNSAVVVVEMAAREEERNGPLLSLLQGSRASNGFGSSFGAARRSGCAAGRPGQAPWLSCGSSRSTVLRSPSGTIPQSMQSNASVTPIRSAERSPQRGQNSSSSSENQSCRSTSGIVDRSCASASWSDSAAREWAAVGLRPPPRRRLAVFGLVTAGAW
jgi:hypothetical protein